MREIRPAATDALSLWATGFAEPNATTPSPHGGGFSYRHHFRHLSLSGFSRSTTPSRQMAPGTLAFCVCIAPAGITRTCSASETRTTRACPSALLSARPRLRQLSVFGGLSAASTRYEPSASCLGCLATSSRPEGSTPCAEPCLLTYKQSVLTDQHVGQAIMQMYRREVIGEQAISHVLKSYEDSPHDWGIARLGDGLTPRLSSSGQGDGEAGFDQAAAHRH